MAYLTTAVLLINGWTGNIFTAEAATSMSREHMSVLKAHITAFLSFTVTSGLIMVHMMAGGDMIHFLSLIMKVQRNLKNIFCTLERNGCLHHTMLTDGDLTWRQIWDIVPSITMNSGKSSESQLRMPIHKLLFWRSIMAIHMTGSQAESGTRL